MPSVFPINPAWPLEHTLVHSNHVANMGSGFEQRLNLDLAYSRADGEGGVTSYKGQNRFVLKFKVLEHVNSDSSKDANKLWSFYKARTGSLESFYLYNPAEASIDLTGVATAGRYLVRFEESKLSREQFTLKLFSAGIPMIEVRA